MPVFRVVIVPIIAQFCASLNRKSAADTRGVNLSFGCAMMVPAFVAGIGKTPRCRRTADEPLYFYNRMEPMDFKETREEEKATLDLHGLTVDEAEMQLIEFLEALPKKVRVVEVTHGYSRGTALKRMVKEDFYHWRIRDKRVGLNPGATYLLLK